MMSPARFVLCGCLLVATNAAYADEGKFLQSFKGNFAGKGAVQVTTEAPTVSVSCTFKSDSTSSSLSLDGNCRGLILMSRAISAHLKTSGTRYSGVYVGSRTGPAQLNGSRSGNAINLAIRWAKPVNGNSVSQLTVEKKGTDGILLTVTDHDPKTGKNVVTSRIDLKRT
ncbi:hypothetical protein FJ934_13515 [Mesorhizobium sp. B2-4-12]|uniref:hypothetical protein n=1 Tax=unclassified Mesorhizobium TaxID=325217 RepID=UPI001126595A|nr:MULTISPECIES: hypothetical protein [unclassified Mesorhizobium]TPK94900.1 hypothetical protein FJ934_13515 [Mesorhizobium sp. B2-4-12]UCI33311.1 hypothetical protein FJW03_07755 [Mesorhizobium sp. B4-1-4]